MGTVLTVRTCKKVKDDGVFLTVRTVPIVRSCFPAKRKVELISAYLKLKTESFKTNNGRRRSPRILN